MRSKIFYIKNRHNGRCLDTDGINFFLTKYDKENNSQKWSVEKIRKNEPAGIYNETYRGYLSIVDGEISFVNDITHEWIFFRGKIINKHNSLVLYASGFFGNCDIEFCPVSIESYIGSMTHIWKAVPQIKIDKDVDNVSFDDHIPRLDFIIDKVLSEIL